LRKEGGLHRRYATVTVANALGHPGTALVSISFDIEGGSNN